MVYEVLDETSTRTKQPSGLKIRLYNHQLSAIDAMIKLENNENIIEENNNIITYHSKVGILGDRVGSGKSYTAIGLILNNEKPNIKDEYAVGKPSFYLKKTVDVDDSNGVTLVAVPHNIIMQWEKFFEKSNLKLYIINTLSQITSLCNITKSNTCPYVTSQTAKMNTYLTSNNNMVKRLQNNGNITYEIKVPNQKKCKRVIKEVDVILLNINKYKQFKILFPTEKWSRIMIDEIDSIKMPKLFSENATFTWFLTATPERLNGYNNAYIHRMMDGINPYRKYITVKNMDYYVEQSLKIPEPHVFLIKSKLKRVVAAMQEFIPNDVLNLINAGNTKEAIRKLNCDVDTENNIIAVLQKSVVKEIHNKKAELKYLKTIIPQNIDIHNDKIVTLRNHIKSLNDRLNRINEITETLKNECCFICADNFENPAVLKCCKSVFCLKCLLASLKISDGKCPYCRKNVGSKDYYVVSQKEKVKKPKSKKIVVKQNIFSEMDKGHVLSLVIENISMNDESPKILIFSDYAGTFTNIDPILRKYKLEYSHIGGTPVHITNTIAKFGNGEINILLLDSKHYGSGLNLQMANYTIIYHRMDKNLETQVIGRAHRPGRSQPLKIIYLIDDNEDDRIHNNIQLMNKKDLKKIFN
jgi:hypothetical protein